MILGIILCHEFSRTDTKNDFYFVKFVQSVAEIFAAACHKDDPRFAGEPSQCENEYLLHRKQTMTRENWEVAHEVSGELQAELLRGLLDAQGVPARLSQEGAGRAYGINVGRLGQVQILVPTSHLDRARSIINDYYAGVFEEEDDSD
jgi:hypothetical protein